MRHLWLHESDRQAEMTVVRNEYERGKNDPESVLLEEVMEAAYVALPYHHPTIGWKSDIEHVPIAKLREFYDTFYWPNNATLTVVGDIETDAVLGLIKKYYGVYPHSPAPIPAIYTEEPAQSGERRVIVKRPGELGSIIVAHKVPNGRDADQAALEMLDAILSSGKNARLYRALVDQGLALSAGAGTDLHHDLSLHTLYAALTPGTTHEQVEKALLAELNKIKNSGVTAAEVATRQAAIHCRGRLQARRHGRGRQRAERMDRRRRLDAVCHVSAESPTGHPCRCAASRQAILRRGSEHHRLVRAGCGEAGEGLVIRISLLMMLFAAGGAAAANMAEQTHRCKSGGHRSAHVPQQRKRRRRYSRRAAGGRRHGGIRQHRDSHPVGDDARSRHQDTR